MEHKHEGSVIAFVDASSPSCTHAAPRPEKRKWKRPWRQCRGAFALSARRPMRSAAAAMHCDLALRHRPARLEGGGPATPPLRQSVMRCASTPPGETPRGTFPGVGLASRVMTLQVMFFGAGVEPATLGLLDRCSNRLSYPVVDEPESNRRPATRVAALTAELPPSRNTFPRTSAYATAGPRVPDGTRTRTAAIRSTMLRIGACAGANPVRYRSGRRPCRASRHSALAPLSGCILLSDKDCPDASGCESVTRNMCDPPLRTHKAKRPRR